MEKNSDNFRNCKKQVHDWLYRNQYWIILLFLLIIFWNFINQMLLKYVIPITSTIANDSILVRIVIFLLILFYFYITDAFKKKYIPCSRYTFEFSFFSFYIVTKHITPPYTYYPTESSCDYVLESFIIILVIEVILALTKPRRSNRLIIVTFKLYLTIKRLIIKKAKRERKLQDIKIIPFYSDVPTDRDDFKRGKYAKLLLNKIQATFEKEMKQSFTISISEEYGYGKTSFFLLLKNKIKKDKNKSFITIDFKPWLCENANSIIKEYFSLLKNHLKYYDGRLYKIIESYVSKLIDEFPTNTFTASIKALRSFTSMGDEYEKIKLAINKINKPILVFIDDVDRLQKEELNILLKLIRNTANFPNLFYILAADKKSLKGMLKQIGVQEAEIYLKKFINFELFIPGNDNVIKSTFKSKLRELLINYYKTHSDIDDLLKKEVEIITKFIQSKDIFNNFRDLYRFLNTYCYAIDAVNEDVNLSEINLSELFKVELIKYLNPDLYKILRDHDGWILDNEGDKIVLNNEDIQKQIEKHNKQKYYFLKNSLQKSSDSEEKKETVEEKKTLSEIIESLNLNNAEKQVYDLLKDLFPSGISYIDKNSIQKFDNYFKYVGYGIRKDEVTYAEVKYTLVKSPGCKDSVMEQVVNNNKYKSFLNKAIYVSEREQIDVKIFFQQLFSLIDQIWENKKGSLGDNTNKTNYIYNDFLNDTMKNIFYYPFSKNDPEKAKQNNDEKTKLTKLFREDDHINLLVLFLDLINEEHRHKYYKSDEAVKWHKIVEARFFVKIKNNEIAKDEAKLIREKLDGIKN